MTANELYRSFLNELSHIYPNTEAADITSIIFEHFAGLDRKALVQDPGRILDKQIMLRISESLADLKNHKPVQYITGEGWFYKMKLKVSPAVLIPRPETEELAEAVINSIQEQKNATIIDIGTGSGCIAIAIKKNIPACNMTAIDISATALKIAKENAADMNADVRFIETDFLSEEKWDNLGKYNVIVSNPPYIPENEMDKMDKNVTAYEPHGALFVDNQRPLIFYEKIHFFAGEHLDKKGMIFLETHEDLAQEVCRLFNADNYIPVIKKDISGKERMVIVTKRM